MFEGFEIRRVHRSTPSTKCDERGYCGYGTLYEKMRAITFTIVAKTTFGTDTRIYSLTQNPHLHTHVCVSAHTCILYTGCNSMNASAAAESQKLDRRIKQ